MRSSWYKDLRSTSHSLTYRLVSRQGSVDQVPQISSSDLATAPHTDSLFFPQIGHLCGMLVWLFFFYHQGLRCWNVDCIERLLMKVGHGQPLLLGYLLTGSTMVSSDPCVRNLQRLELLHSKRGKGFLLMESQPRPEISEDRGFLWWLATRGVALTRLTWCSDLDDCLGTSTFDLLSQSYPPSLHHHTEAPYFLREFPFNFSLPALIHPSLRPLTSHPDSPADSQLLPSFHFKQTES